MYWSLFFEINQFKDIPLHSVLKTNLILIIKHLKISFLGRFSLIDIYIILFFVKFTGNIFSSVFSPLLYLIYKTFRSLYTIFSSYIYFLVKKIGSIVKLSNIISSKVVFDYKVMAACIDNTKCFTKYICQYEMNIIYLFFVYFLFMV